MAYERLVGVTSPSDPPDPGSFPNRALDATEGLLERASLRVADSPKLQVALQSIPIIGSGISTFFSAHGQRLTQERLLALCEALRADVNRVGSDKLDRSFFGSEEGVGLFSRVARAAAEERDSEKVRLYAALLVGSAVRDRPGAAPEPEALLGALIELTPIEVRLLRLIAMATAGGAAWPAPGMEIPSEVGQDHAFHLKRIERTGLIAEVPTYDRTQQSGRYEPTPTLGRLMDLLRAGGYVDVAVDAPLDPALIAPKEGCIFCGAAPTSHPILSAPIFTIRHDDGRQETVTMPAQVHFCSACAVDFTKHRRRHAGCWSCRRWGPEGMLCPECLQPLQSLEYQ